MIGSLLAQYRIVGSQVEPPKKASSQVTLDLAPAYMHIVAQGKWDTLQGELDFVFLPDKVFWVDNAKKIAYQVPVLPQDTLPFQVEQLGSAEVAGRRGVKVRFRLPEASMEVVWDTTVSYSWDIMLKYLSPRELGTPARHFRKGIPLCMRVVDEKGQLLLEFQAKEIQSFTPSSTQQIVPYPVRRLVE